MTARGSEQRKHIRFKGEWTEYAQMCFHDFTKPFENQLVGLIYDESFGGCGLIMMEHEWIKRGSLCRVVVGALSPMKAEIVHLSDIHPNVIKVGLRFLE